MQSAAQVKSDKNNVTCIQCADKECFKTLTKQSLVSTVIQYSSNAIVFAVN